MFIDHEAEAGTDDVPDLDRVVGRVVATEIAGALTAVVAVALVRTARARVGNHALVANLRTGKKTVVPSQGKSHCNYVTKRRSLRIFEYLFIIIISKSLVWKIRTYLKLQQL